MLGDNSIPLEVRADWVWSRVAATHPEIKRENFPGPLTDVYMIYDLIVDNVCRYTPRPGHRVMDVGANVGVFTALCALNGAVVTAYEPNHEAAVTFHEVMRRNHLVDRVTFHLAAVWKDTGVATLWHWPGQINSAKMFQYGPPGEHSLVPTVSLADAIGDEEWDCVKMDIEGGEFELLATAGAELRQVKYLTVELHNDCASKTTYDAMVSNLRRYFVLDGIPDGSPEFKPEGRWISLFGRTAQVC